MATLIAHRHRCDEVAGDLPGGKFLHQLLRWYNYTKVKHGGHKWVSLTHAQWAKETNLTVDQIRRILTRLGKAKLIVREQHRFKGITPNFIRPSTTCFEALCATQGALPGAGQGAQKCAAPLKPLKKPKEETKVATACAVAIPAPGSEEEESGKTIHLSEIKDSEAKESAAAIHSQQDQLDMIAAPMAEQEVMIALAAIPLKKVDTSQPDKVSTLVAVWQNEHAAKGLPAYGVTAKMRGQFKHLIVSLPQGAAPRFVSFAIQNWSQVIDEAEALYGAWKSPDAPSIDYLVKYMNAVASVMTNAAKKQAIPAHVQDAKQFVLQKPEAPWRHEDEKPATWEEIQAIEAMTPEEWDAFAAADEAQWQLKLAKHAEKLAKYEAELALFNKGAS